MTKQIIDAGASFPKIIVKQLDGAEISLGEIDASMDWKLIVVYRGRHCPKCTDYLNTLEGYKQKLLSLKVGVVAVSADSQAQLKDHLNDIDISFTLAYGLSLEQMKSLGVYISTPRSEKETDHPFAEPALYVVNSQGRIQIVDISNAPFARPDLEALVSGIAFVKDPGNNYPIRGTHK